MRFEGIEHLGEAVGTVAERKPAAEFQFARRGGNYLFQRDGDLLAADRLFIIVVFKPAALVGRIAEDERKFFVVLPADVLHAAAHGRKIFETVQADAAPAHFGKFRLHFKERDRRNLRIERIKMQSHDAAARAEIRDGVAYLRPRETRQ